MVVTRDLGAAAMHAASHCWPCQEAIGSVDYWSDACIFYIL